MIATPGDIGALVHNFGNSRWKRCKERLCDHYRFDLAALIAVRTNCCRGEQGVGWSALPVPALFGLRRPRRGRIDRLWDPGNFATNIRAGAKYGYTLL